VRRVAADRLENFGRRADGVDVVFLVPEELHERLADQLLVVGDPDAELHALLLPPFFDLRHQEGRQAEPERRPPWARFARSGFPPCSRAI